MARELYTDVYLHGDEGFKMLYVHCDGAKHPDLELPKLRKICFSMFSTSDWCISNIPVYTTNSRDSRQYSYIIGSKSEEDLVIFKLKTPDVSRVTSWDSRTKFMVVKNTACNSR